MDGEDEFNPNLIDDAALLDDEVVFGDEDEDDEDNLEAHGFHEENEPDKDF